MQACFSSIQTGCAIGSESKDALKGGGRRGVGFSVDRIEVLLFHFLPGDHRAGLRLARGGGGGAELGEAAVARLQAGH